MAVRIDIRINGESLDLPTEANDVFFITRQIHDILRGLETREGDFTRSISLPKTVKNLRITRAATPVNFDRESNNFLPCSVLFDGVSVVNDAQFATYTVGPRTIEARIFGGNTGFFSQLSDENLQAVDLSAYNFNMRDWSFNRSNTSGVVQTWSLWTDNESARAMIRENGDPADFNLNYPNIQFSGFHFFIYTLLEEIFKQLDGLTVDMSNLNEQFRKLAVAVPVYQWVDGWESSAGFQSYGIRDVEEGDPADPFPPNQTTIITPVTFTDSTGLWDVDGWVIPTAGLVTVDVDLKFPPAAALQVISGIVQVTVNDEIRYSENFRLAQFVFTFVNFRTSVNVQPGDKIRVQIQAGQNTSEGFYLYYNNRVSKPGGTPDGFIEVADEMPDVPQKQK